MGSQSNDLVELRGILSVHKKLTQETSKRIRSPQRNIGYFSQTHNKMSTTRKIALDMKFWFYVGLEVLSEQRGNKGFVWFWSQHVLHLWLIPLAGHHQIKCQEKKLTQNYFSLEGEVQNKSKAPEPNCLKCKANFMAWGKRTIYLKVRKIFANSMNGCRVQHFAHIPLQWLPSRVICMRVNILVFMTSCFWPR